VSSDFYGRGAGYPLRIGPSGGVEESAGVRKVEGSIRMILGTQYGERAMRPDFGCNLRSLVFAPNNESTAGLARHYVEEGLHRWEPRIELLRVDVRNDNTAGRLLIEIQYRLRSTPDIHNLVYPFYLEKP